MEQKYYNKLYWEEYARLSLSVLFPEFHNHFFVSDKPDLQNNIENIGIEVTNATPEEYRERDAYATKYYGKMPTDKEITNFQGEFFFDKNGVVIGSSPTRGLVTPINYIDINHIIEEKKKKANNYTKFRTLGIYIFSPLFLLDTDVETISSMDTTPFDFLIINCQDVLYYIDKGEIKTNDISSEQMCLFKREALRYSFENYDKKR